MDKKEFKEKTDRLLHVFTEGLKIFNTTFDVDVNFMFVVSMDAEETQEDIKTWNNIQGNLSGERLKMLLEAMLSKHTDFQDKEKFSGRIN